MSIDNTRTWWSRPGCLGSIFASVALVLGSIWVYFNLYQGRDFSRFTGVPVKVEMPACITNFEQVVSISFHSRSSGETIKDLTYTCDGRLYSQEYTDFGVLQGSVEWVLSPQR